MKNEKKVSVIVIILMILSVIIFAKPVIKHINYGLDLKGGFEVLYEVKPLNEKDKLTNEMLVATYKSINNRIDTLGVSEPVIDIEGNNIRVQLPGVKNEEMARKRLSTPAVLTFRNSKDELMLNSDILNSPGAKLDYNENSLPVVALNIKDKDAFYKVTKEISESDDQLINIWLDFEEGISSFEKEKENCGKSGSACISSARVKEGFASNVVIEGHFSVEEAENLVDLINSGSLPTKISEISTKTVDASFGENTLKIAAISGIVTLLLITLIMTLFYRKSGLISSICLIFYSLIVFGIFNAIDGVLTLTGIAALILGIGMAVDSSIVTLEKIKDELRQGNNIIKSFKEANKRSLISLIDANVTTLIVAIILFVLGESAVKGFGLMLIVTILVTMITMILINRYVLKGFVNKETNINSFIGKIKENKEKDFMKYSKYIISLVIILIIIAVVVGFNKKVNLGIDFVGGSRIMLKSDEKINTEDIKQYLNKFEVINMSKTNDNEMDIVIKNILQENEINKLREDFDSSKINSNISVISNVVKKDLTNNAIKAISIAFICILIYMGLRFTFNFGLSGLVAILVDILSVISIFVILNIEINFIFIAAILTIIGYSINDTIIIFDLIREKKKINEKTNNRIIVNACLTTALRRSILTTITTLISVIMLLILGADGIFEFNIAILIGLTSGTFSSLYIAPYIWAILDKNKKTKNETFDDGPEEKIIKGINS